MSKRTLKYVKTSFGCAIRVGSDRDILNDIGRSNVDSIRLATEADVAWVRGMGGRIPDGVIAKAKEAK